MVFHPDYRFEKIWAITPEWLRAHKISVLLLDIDNTLTTHNNPEVLREAKEWIGKMKAAGFRLLVLSNNKPQRVEPFAHKLGLHCIAKAAKPLGLGIRRALRRLHIPKSALALIGDQIFTDVLCANLAGIVSILVEPIEPEAGMFFRIKRRLEKLIINRGQGAPS